ncbi:hypothetical protein NIES1031_00550 [Chroogloeocystis siderophila 5.2 s.c.1]|jgi:hypothetical protein|uniref:Uncharacterized protein n=1 Tax=Chroogloeocystis siderophila 5.2 s.c.1 TaxID=247279 RepID=A0A1U7HZR2_9CHRO|nr:hypothetical protein NIES1031_00550 [Chroogloeocystis siderophila 5.2 s.c.1]
MFCSFQSCVDKIDSTVAITSPVWLVSYPPNASSWFNLDLAAGQTHLKIRKWDEESYLANDA